MIKNEIIAEINNKCYNSKVRIINSFENTKRENPSWNWNNIETKESLIPLKMQIMKIHILIGKKLKVKKMKRKLKIVKFI